MKHTKVLAKTVLRNREGNILLLRRSKTDTRRPDQWDFPGGNVEDDEDFLVAAVRETFEEANVTIASSDLHLAYTTAAITEAGNACWLIFIGEVDMPEVKLSFEHSEFIWVPLEKAIELVTYDRQNNALVHIRDAKLFE